MEKIVYRALTVKDTSGMNLRTSHPQLSGKVVSIEKETPKLKLCLKKSTLPVKKSE